MFSLAGRESSVDHSCDRDDLPYMGNCSNVITYARASLLFMDHTIPLPVSPCIIENFQSAFSSSDGASIWPVFWLKPQQVLYSGMSLVS